MKQIPLTKNKFALIDDEDFERVSQRKWSCGSKGHGPQTAGPGAYPIAMHKFILEDYSSQLYDHINRNPYDNRRCNLRKATKSQNSMNRGLPKHNKSGYKNIHWYKSRNQWRVYLTVNGNWKSIGYFNDLNDAILARDKALREYHGEFACLESA